jgi:hypothetical protein
MAMPMKAALALLRISAGLYWLNMEQPFKINLQDSHVCHVRPAKAKPEQKKIYVRLLQKSKKFPPPSRMGRGSKSPNFRPPPVKRGGSQFARVLQEAHVIKKKAIFRADCVALGT